MSDFAALPPELVELIFQHLYISFICGLDNAFFHAMKVLPHGQSIGERLFYDTDTSVWDVKERAWRIPDLERAERDQWVMRAFARVRRHYYEQGMLRWQGGGGRR